jgi:hypothetical protein
MRSAIALVAALALAAPELDAQASDQAPSPAAGARRQAQAARTTQPPVIDGVLDDDAWQQAQPITGFVQRAPNPGAAATLPTEARILYDDGAVYVSMRMHDPSPDSLVTPLGRRDLAGISSEWAHVMIDSYNDRRTAFRFSVNPRGVQKDAFHSNDTNEDLGWDAVWQSGARVDSAGWTVEYRIPLSQLRYSGAAGEQTWGIQVTREIARRSEVVDWSRIHPDRNGFVSQFGELAGIRGLRTARRLEVIPYSVARVTRAPGTAEDPYWSRNDGFGSMGADVKYGLTSDFTLTATINPDFGQVEADPSEVNLSAFESFFQERRPFFTEGSDIFSFNVGFPYSVRGAHFGNDQPFYSRRLGRQPQGGAPDAALFASAPEATTILGAAKLSGKTRSGWSIGLLDAVTAQEDVRFLTGDGRDALVAEPMTNYAVGRVIKDFNGGQSAVGAIATATHRDLEGADELSWMPSSAYLAGLDARHRFGGDNYLLGAALVGTHVRGSEDAIAGIQTRAGHYFQRPDADHLDLDLDATTLSGWMGRASVEKVGGGHWRGGVYTHARSPGLEMNDLGYIRNADWLLAGARLGYVEFRPGKVFRNWNAGLHQWNGWSFGRERLSTGFNAGAEGTYLNNWGSWVNMNHEFQALRADVLRGGPSFTGPAYTNFETGFWTDSRRRVFRVQGSVRRPRRPLRRPLSDRQPPAPLRGHVGRGVERVGDERRRLVHGRQPERAPQLAHPALRGAADQRLAGSLDLRGRGPCGRAVALRVQPHPQPHRGHQHAAELRLHAQAHAGALRPAVRSRRRVFRVQGSVRRPRRPLRRPLSRLRRGNGDRCRRARRVRRAAGRHGRPGLHLPQPRLQLQGAAHQRRAAVGVPSGEHGVRGVEPRPPPLCPRRLLPGGPRLRPPVRRRPVAAHERAAGEGELLAEPVNCRE